MLNNFYSKTAMQAIAAQSGSPTHNGQDEKAVKFRRQAKMAVMVGIWQKF